MPRGRTPVPDRNLAFDLVRTTEAAALAASRWVGRGDKDVADQAAIDAMLLTFNSVDVDGLVVISAVEEPDAEAPQRRDLGRLTARSTRLTIRVWFARGQANGLSLVAVARPRNDVLTPGSVYIEKIATELPGSKAIDITPIGGNICNIAEACGIEIPDLIVSILTATGTHSQVR